VNYAEQRAKTLFFVWVSLTEHKWVILRERRGNGSEVLEVWPRFEMFYPLRNLPTSRSTRSRSLRMSMARRTMVSAGRRSSRVSIR
jgi:hypothetical protein